jgi:membrane protein DedA with SNARE-associated domain
MKVHGIVRAVAPQQAVISLVVLLKVLSELSFVPAPENLASLAIHLLSTRGLWLVMVASFAENFAGLGTYFPGSVALVAAMAATAGNPARALSTYVAVVLPAILANVLSFALGHFTRKEAAPTASFTSRKLAAWYFGSYWHPQLAGVTAMASGAAGVTFRRFLLFFLPISVFWSIVWAVLLYNVGARLVAPSYLTVLFYLYLAGWLLWGLRSHQRQHAEWQTP